MEGTMNIDLSQKSTKTGLILLASAVAGLVTGNQDLVDMTVTESGAQVGGTIPIVVTMLIGLWDTFRKEKK
ncbi:hypothetical protein [Photobacterium profundum]|uniref:hypothetical protein n=1 Tax=Photobacterium profundum TaxID=74109 RepID=UPI0003263413|nr:hypothetical protein [Photobacterium profundum]